MGVFWEVHGLLFRCVMQTDVVVKQKMSFFKKDFVLMRATCICTV